MELRIDLEFKSLCPQLKKDEYSKLEASIKRDGCRDPLVIWDGIILDGHNRYEICTKHGIKYNTVPAPEWVKTRQDAVNWIIDNQLGRRNLTVEQRNYLIGKKYQEQKKQVSNPDGINQHNKELGGQNVHQAKTAQKVAEEEKVNEKTVRRAEKFTEAVDRLAETVGDDIKDKILAREINITQKDVKQLARKDPEYQKQAISKVVSGEASSIRTAREKLKQEKRQKKRAKAAEEIKTIDKRIMVDDFSNAAKNIPDGSLSLIFTDPPYNRKASEMLPDLASFAKNKLAEGGSLICYVGQTQLPIAMDAFREGLRYWWTVACLHSGGKTVMREYGINAGWKAVLWFVKGTRDDPTVMVSDVMSGGKEKSHHEWQQAQSEAEYWIEKLCPEDGIVCDPFLGGGTTAVAAENLNRKWIGIEIDRDQAKIASGRVAE